MRTRVSPIVLLGIVLSASAAAPPPSSAAASRLYATEIETWRSARERDLTADEGWLTVAGLVFLKPGVNTVGSTTDNDVVLPPGAPAHAGRLVREQSTVTFEPDGTAGLTLNGLPLAARVPLGVRDRVTVGAVSFLLHESGDRIGIRIRDTNSALRRSFHGLRWFPIREDWKREARFVAYDRPRTITVPNVLGDYETLTVPGEAVLAIDGHEVRLQAARAGKRLWFIFSDGLGGRETYHIRFLYADAPGPDGHVTLDFNRAYNPPCAYNPFTTCPLPPVQNRLAVKIDAGERTYRQ